MTRAKFINREPRLFGKTGDVQPLENDPEMKTEASFRPDGSEEFLWVMIDELEFIP